MATQQERILAARIGAHALHAQYDSRELTANARAAWFARFLTEVDPDHALPDPERLRRAEHRMREHMTRLALRSAKARRKR